MAPVTQKKTMQSLAFILSTSPALAGDFSAIIAIAPREWRKSVLTSPSSRTLRAERSSILNAATCSRTIVRPPEGEPAWTHRPL